MESERVENVDRSMDDIFKRKLNSQSNQRQPIYSKFHKKSFSSTISRDENLNCVKTVLEEEHKEEISVISPGVLERADNCSAVKYSSVDKDPVCGHVRHPTSPQKSQIFYEIDLELVEWQVLHDIQPRHPKLKEFDLIRILKNYDKSLQILKVNKQQIKDDTRSKTTKLIKWNFLALSRLKKVEDIHFSGLNGLVYKFYQVK